MSNSQTTGVIPNYTAVNYDSRESARRATAAFEKSSMKNNVLPLRASTLITTYQNDKNEIGAPVSSAVDRQFAPIVAGIKQDVLINLLSCPRGDLHGQFPAHG